MVNGKGWSNSRKDLQRVCDGHIPYMDGGGARLGYVILRKYVNTKVRLAFYIGPSKTEARTEGSNNNILLLYVWHILFL